MCVSANSHQVFPAAFLMPFYFCVFFQISVKLNLHVVLALIETVNLNLRSLHFPFAVLSAADFGLIQHFQLTFSFTLDSQGEIHF